MTARRDVLHLIDPIKSFNAYNLSLSHMPPQKVLEEDDLKMECFSARSLTAAKAFMLGSQAHLQEHIVRTDPDFVEYVRDGFRCYVSQSLRRELYLTDGILYKRP